MPFGNFQVPLPKYQIQSKMQKLCYITLHSLDALDSLQPTQECKENVQNDTLNALKRTLEVWQKHIFNFAHKHNQLNQAVLVAPAKDEFSKTNRLWQN